MKRLKAQLRRGNFALPLLSLVALLGISATYALVGEPGNLFLPVMVYEVPSPTPTATASPTPTATVSSTPTQGTPGPSATPVPAETIQVTVTPQEKDWAVAFFAKGYNDAGKPVMTIYPSPTSPPSDRIIIPKGTVVTVMKDPVTADGGGKYWQLVDYKGRDGEALFLRTVDVTKVTV